DAAHDLPTHHDGQATFDRNRSFDAKNAKSGTASGQRILECLGWTLKPRRRAGLIDRYIRATVLGIVHLLVIDEDTSRIYNRHGHGPIVFAGFGNGLRGRFLGVLKADRWAISRWTLCSRRGQRTQRKYRSE